MSLDQVFPKISKRNESLAPYTHLKTGGAADWLVQPHTIEELKAVLAYCKKEKLPLRMMGGGFNLLVRDEPVKGVVVRLAGPAFGQIEINGTKVRCGGGANLFDLIARTTQANLRGLETLVGIRGTVGGSVRCNVGDRSGEIGTSVRKVTVLTDDGTEQVRSREELYFGEHSSDLDEPAILWVEFELTQEKPEILVKRMRKAWITRKAGEPFSFQPYVRMFRNPSGQPAAQLIEKAGLSKTKIGSAEVSDRNGNYVVAHPGTTATDILKLLDHVRTTVKDNSGITLDRELNVW